MSFPDNRVWYERQGIYPEDSRWGQLSGLNGDDGSQAFSDIADDQDVTSSIVEAALEVQDVPVEPPPRPCHPVVCFGFGGKMLIMFPRNVQRKVIDVLHMTGVGNSAAAPHATSSPFDSGSPFNTSLAGAAAADGAFDGEAGAAAWAKQQQQQQQQHEEEEEEALNGSGQTDPIPAAVARSIDPSAPDTDAEILEDYQAMLQNAADISGDVKFFNIEVHVRGNSYAFWMHWGHEGQPGQHKLEPCGSKDIAIAKFEKKFHDKTANAWANRAHFEELADRYRLVAAVGDSVKGDLNNGDANHNYDGDDSTVATACPAGENAEGSYLISGTSQSHVRSQSVSQRHAHCDNDHNSTASVPVPDM
jgi:hypothetical protein